MDIVYELVSVLYMGCLSKLFNLFHYRKISKIRRTKSQNLNDSRLVLHLSLHNLLKPDVK